MLSLVKELIVIMVSFEVIMVVSDLSVNGPRLFDKDLRIDKLKVSNQIGYHFKKVIREVSQELFVARRIDVSSLFTGIEILKQTQAGLTRYCKALTQVSKEKIPYSVAKPGYVHITKPGLASFAEAKARCQAKGMQLPEIYTSEQKINLTTFLRTRGIDKVFAGIQPDIIDTLQRFISTGFPLWKTPHERIINRDGNSIKIIDLLDDMNAEFFYTKSGELFVVWESPNIFFGRKPGDHRYREKMDKITQFLVPIVCEPRWDGSSFGDYQSEVAPAHLNLNARRGRDTSRDSESGSFIYMNDTESLKGLKEYCLSIAAQAGEIQQETYVKLRDLLSLVDISVQLERSDSMNRNKRSPFISKYIFSSGAGLIWNLFGFIQRMRMNARIGALEEGLTKTQTQVEDNSRLINNMSLTLYGHSIAIKQLKVTTEDLDRRLNAVERKVEALEALIADVVSKIEATISLSLVTSQIARIQQSLNTGYSILKDVIHSALLGQTSPILLPLDQIRFVQDEVQKVSTAVMDTDFVKMQSVVVADPQDPHLLLVVINAAALARRNTELIKLVPIPYYEGSKTFQPMLDYNTILLDQLSRTYSILTEQEEHDCLTDRCYVSDIEHPVNDRTCGIPQWFNQNIDVCAFQEMLSDGLFIKPMLPDGILFAFKEEVTTQLFCKNNEVVGPIKKLNGTGTLQLPNGCLLSVTDKKGKNTKVKGQPIYRMINARDLELTISGPLRKIHALEGLNNTHRMVVHGIAVSEHLTSIVRQVETVNLQLQNQNLIVWILIGVLSVVVALVLLIAYLAYKHKSKFYCKIYELRKKFMDISKSFTEAESFRIRNFIAPASPKPGLDQVMTGNRPRTYRHQPKNDVGDARLSGSYVAMSELNIPKRNDVAKGNSFQPIRSEPKERIICGVYPPLGPLFGDATDLKSESDEVDRLCNTKFEFSSHI